MLPLCWNNNCNQESEVNLTSLDFRNVFETESFDVLCEVCKIRHQWQISPTSSLNAAITVRTNRLSALIFFWFRIREATWVLSFRILTRKLKLQISAICENNQLINSLSYFQRCDEEILHFVKLFEALLTIEFENFENSPWQWSCLTSAFLIVWSDSRFPVRDTKTVSGDEKVCHWTVCWWPRPDASPAGWAWPAACPRAASPACPCP